MRIYLLLMLSLVVCVRVSIAADLIAIKSGMLTGNTYRELPLPERQAYVVGLLEGMFLAPAFHANKKDTAWIEQCAVGMTNEQVAAIVDKFLRDNPGRWHEQMNILGLVAMKEACEK